MGGVDPLFLALQEAVLGRYALERELGRGGMGIVYLARDIGLDRPVAIKLLPPDLSAQTRHRERFLREARMAARLSHPNIVPIHAVEEAGGLVFFVMAFIPGESFGERLRVRGALPPGEVLPVLREAALGLGHAHAQGVVHRDVKPDNILLDGTSRRALLADFGVAAPLRADLADGTVVGTVAYLSPEQARGEAVDARSDLYALGVVGYLALGGRFPYPAATLAELVERQLAGQAPSLASVAPHVPRALCRAIDRCLAPFPTSRFQTGEELAGVLDQLGAGPPELPAPLRVWLTKGSQARGALMLWSLLWGLPALFGAIAMAVEGRSGVVWMVTMLGSVIAVPWSLYAVSRGLQTRKVLAAGYTPADLILAIRNAAERRREELAFEIGRPPSRVGRMLRRVTWGAFLATIASSLLLPWSWGLFGRKALTFFWVGLAGTSVLGALVGFFIPGRDLPARDRWSEWRERFWTGPLGRSLVWLAGWRLKRRGAPEHTLHRPTEIALGEAADALFQALPAEQRRDLKALPEQIQFLSTQASLMRRRLEELDDLIVHAAPDTLFGERSSRAGDGGAGELREARDQWGSRLTETLSTLESLRVGLLRLHAGSAVPDTLTADLEAARELRERLMLLHEARAETEDALRGAAE
jgi:serine/threonine-protein kinase